MFLIIGDWEYSHLKWQMWKNSRTPINWHFRLCQGYWFWLAGSKSDSELSALVGMGLSWHFLFQCSSCTKCDWFDFVTESTTTH